VIEAGLTQILDEAESSVFIAIFSFTDDDLGAAVVRAYQRDVEVRVILEGRNADSMGSEAKKLYKADIPIKIDTASGSFHHKFAVVDGEIVITGSYNWSARADEDNFENVVVIKCSEIASAYTSEFEKLWCETVSYVPPDGGADWCPGCTCLEKLNRATQAQYMEVHGIGPVLSKSIVEYRDRIGGFASPYQLDAVNGIGPERMEAILRYFCPELYEDPPT
jgi:phosphatidylserine/phosphatidylglycerophosphate/cardiolipin synthase-like enzyme